MPFDDTRFRTLRTAVRWYLCRHGGRDLGPSHLDIRIALCVPVSSPFLIKSKGLHKSDSSFGPCPHPRRMQALEVVLVCLQGPGVELGHRRPGEFDSYRVA